MPGSVKPFGPEVISLLKGVFDDAVAELPTRLRTAAVKALIAERILKHAANGERDRAKLLTLGLLDLQATLASSSLIRTEQMRPAQRPPAQPISTILT